MCSLERQMHQNTPVSECRVRSVAKALHRGLEALVLAPPVDCDVIDFTSLRLSSCIYTKGVQGSREITWVNMHLKGRKCCMGMETFDWNCSHSPLSGPMSQKRR